MVLPKKIYVSFDDMTKYYLPVLQEQYPELKEGTWKCNIEYYSEPPVAEIEFTKRVGYADRKV